MIITWLGHSCFKIECQEGTIVIDPYIEGMVPGLRPLQLEADRVICTHQHADHNYIQAVHISGKKETIKINTIKSYHDKFMGLKRGNNNIYIIESEGYRIAHLGDLGCSLTKSQMDQLKDLDVLLIPVGGIYTIDSSDAAKIIHLINPKISIPMHYRLGTMGMPELEELVSFTKHFDNVRYYETNKIELTKDMLPQVAILKYFG